MTDPLYKLQHSAAHVMAQAIRQVFPDAQFAIGPPIKDGFYYDVQLPRPLLPEDLATVEARMKEIIAGNHPFIRRVVSQEEARELFKDQPFKLELIDGLAKNQDENGDISDSGGVITTYRQDDFEDLCRGPHLEHTGQIPCDAFALTNVAGAYWRGDSNRPMLQRMYGTVWPTKEGLQAYLWRQEEARKRDHRKLGRELGLYIVSEEVGPGLPLWLPKGAMIRATVEDFCRAEHLERGYQLVYSPHIGRGKLWETSGHLDYYRENMFPAMQMDGEEYFAKPMNCPFHIQVYKSQLRSYRDLPQRYSENGTVYRFEQSGVLHGLTRVRGFTQDDAHLFCRPDQVEAEISGVLEFARYILEAFDLGKCKAYLSTQPAKSVGRPEDWEMATAALKKAIAASGLPCEVDEGGGAFYGPKIDLKVQDALGREWQLTTCQVDFNLPERFDLNYTGDDGKEHRPIMLHRTLLGSMERFFGVLIEHYAGAFPLWLAPVQVVVIPISTIKHGAYAEQVLKRLKDGGIRAELHGGNDRMQARIRNAQMQKTPYMLILGDREQEQQVVNVRERCGHDISKISIEMFIARIQTQITTRRASPEMLE